MFIPFYRPEPRITWYKLPSLRASALWLLSTKTHLRLNEMREGIMVTGMEISGSGGIGEGRVKAILLKGDI